MRRSILLLPLLILFLPGTQAQVQDTLSLDRCLSASIANQPFSRLIDISKEKEDLIREQSTTSWYPSLNLGANASYQSDVTAIPLEIPGIDIPSPTKDQYGVYLEVRQTIYDAGLTAAKRSLDLIGEEISRNQVNMQSRDLKQQASDAFFAVLLIRSQREILQLTGEDLHEQLERTQALFENGVISRRNLLDLEAALVSWRQQMVSVRSAEESGYQILRRLTGLEVDSSTVMMTGHFAAVYSPLAPRTPELREFELREMQLGVAGNISMRKRFPKAAAFGKAGYGRPGLNMLSDEFDDYYLVGATITWSPWDWGASRMERDMLEFQRQELDARRELYMTSVDIRATKLRADIARYPEMIDQADSLILIRKEIRDASSAALEEGALSSADYLLDHNAYVKAMLERKTYEIALSQSISNYILLNRY